MHDSDSRAAHCPHLFARDHALQLCDVLVVPLFFDVNNLRDVRTLLGGCLLNVCDPLLFGPRCVQLQINKSAQMHASCFRQRQQQHFTLLRVKGFIVPSLVGGGDFMPCSSVNRSMAQTRHGAGRITKRRCTTQLHWHLSSRHDFFSQRALLLAPRRIGANGSYARVNLASFHEKKGQACVQVLWRQRRREIVAGCTLLFGVDKLVRWRAK